MSDTLEWRQRYATQFEMMQTHADRRQAAIHTGMPATIVSFDAQTMTAVVKPALRGGQTKPDGSVEPVEIANIHDVPVHFPGGGGHSMTFPVKEGDECWIAFSERSIDHWHQHGDVQDPSDHRMHDINDAVATVGLRSQAKLPSNGAHPSAVELRSDDGTASISLDGGTGEVKLNADRVAVSKGGGHIGFYGTGPQAKPTITGSKQNNPALTSLIQHLAQLGLIEDATT